VRRGLFAFLQAAVPGPDHNWSGPQEHSRGDSRDSCLWRSAVTEYAGSPGSLLYLTDVAPYATVSGSDVSARIAGVHQSLTSSVLALEEMAELAGLSFVHRSRVSLVSTDDLERAEALG